MKTTKIIALALLLCIIAASFSFAHVPDDVLNTEFENSGSIMIDLEIMENRDDSLFHPEEEVTRAEFAIYVYRLLGLSHSVNERYYTDVLEGDPGFNEINVLTVAGLVRGTDENIFSPDSFVKYEEALKMLVSMCGYESMANIRGGYPTGYFITASELKINGGISVRAGEYLKRGEVSKLLYNAMNVDVLEQVLFSDNAIKFEKTKGNTVLNVYSSIYQLKGILSANEHSGISMPTGACRENYVRVAGMELNIGKTTADELLGQDVEVYYHLDEESDTKIIKSIKRSTRNLITEIAAEDIIDYNNGVYRYGTIDKPREIRLSDVSDIIFNRKAYVGQTDKSLFMPGNGRVLLIDNNGDNKIDVVWIESYKTYFVEKINSRDYMIFDKYLQPSVNLEGISKKYKIMKDGEEVRIDSIKENTVIMIYADREKIENGISIIDDVNSTLYKVILCAESVTGPVTEVTYDNNNKQIIVIDGKKYGVSADFLNASALDPQKAPPIKAGDSGTYYLDNNNQISGTLFKKLDSGKYGFLVGTGKVTPVSDKYQMKIFAYDNVMRIYDVQDKIDYNGVRTGALDVFLHITPKKLIHYMTNDEGKITAVNTAVVKPESAPLYDYQQVFSLDKKFAKSVNVFNDRGILSSQYRVTSDTVCFTIPVDTSGNVTDNSDEEFSITAFSNGRRYNDLELYDVELNLRIGAIVLYDSSGSGGGSVSNAQDIMVVDNVMQAVNDAGDNITKIVGYTGGNKMELSTKNLDIKMVNETEGGSTWRNNEGTFAKDLLKGDVIQYTTDTMGYVSAIRVLAHDIGNIVYGYEGINEGVTNELSLSEDAAAPAPRLYYHESYFGIGEVTSIFSDVAEVYISNKDWSELNGAVPPESETKFARTRTYIKAPGTVVYVFDKTNNKLSVGDFTNVEPGDYLATHIRGGNVNSMVVVKH